MVRSKSWGDRIMSNIRNSNNQVNITQNSNVVKIQPQVEKVVTVLKNNKVVVRAPGIAGPKGDQGSMLLTGEGTPTISVGKVGDLYLDSLTKRLYGPKDVAGWDLNQYTILVGSSFYTGPNNPTNDLGNNRDSFLNYTTSIIYTKISGVWSDPQLIVQPSLYSFTYERQIPSNVWVINHNLRFRPAVTVIDYGDNNIECDIEHIDENQLELRFSDQISGYAYLS